MHWNLFIRNHPTAFFIIGTVVGFIFVFIGLLFPEKEKIFGDSVAIVNEYEITKQEYLRSLSGYSNDSKNPMTEEIQKNILDRLIEEELLVQRGIELGLAQRDRAIRSQIVRTVIQNVLSENVSSSPNELSLRAYYLLNKDKFLASLRYKVLAYEAKDEYDAKEIVLNLNLNQYPERKTFARLPVIYLPPHKLVDYIGPTATEIIRSLKPGEVSQSVAFGGKPIVLKLISIQTNKEQNFNSIRKEIEAAYIQDEGDKELSGYIQSLKKKAKIKIYLDGTVVK
ncbi:SurA N-terminal domain-containing protein [Leptospira sp. 'Mane']|uniref:SurA N-terminal domain-containing protein n=1 Tax=Leptospira sp. 'Mane' TaxID=3387407 RepID=UPI00398BAB7E